MEFDLPRPNRGLAFAIAAAIFGLDRFTKWLIESRVGFFDTYKIIPGFFDIVRSTNRGVAFGLFNDSNFEWRTTLLILGSLAACIVVSVMLWRAERLDRAALWGLALILGGAAGNVFDRILWGRVTDFLLLYFGSYQWPTFNIADSAIVIGSGLLILDQFRGKRQIAQNVP
jgi:signal peptidase II